MVLVWRVDMQAIFGASAAPLNHPKGGIALEAPP
jgi:hypothetical protein